MPLRRRRAADADAIYAADDASAADASAALRRRLIAMPRRLIADFAIAPPLSPQMPAPPMPCHFSAFAAALPLLRRADALFAAAAAAAMPLSLMPPLMRRRQVFAIFTLFVPLLRRQMIRHADCATPPPRRCRRLCCRRYC